MCGGQGMYGTKPMGFGSAMPERSKPFGVDVSSPPPTYGGPTSSATPEMSQPFNVQAPHMPVLQNPAQRGTMDARMAFQRGLPQDVQNQYNPTAYAQTPVNAQPTAGLFPGATPPPGYVAPPPGPFADWTNPLLASMLGRTTSAQPPGMNAYNVGTNQWGNIDWFPGIPKG